MALFSMIAVLLIEQIRPLPYAMVVTAPLNRWAEWLEAWFNAGKHSHGIVAWLVGVGALVLVAGGGYALLRTFSPVAAWLWSVLILYMTMSFRQFSHHYTVIELALRLGDLAHAREVLGEWRGAPADDLSAAEIAHESIRRALMASHNHVFGVLACFVLLPGPCGAVLYRAAAFFSDRWGTKEVSSVDDFGRFARQAFKVIDWLPARLTAAGFAVVGSFEDAVYGWRASSPEHEADSGGERSQAIVLAAGMGALGVRSGALADGFPGSTREETGLDLMQSAVGLVWRALLLWLLLLLLLGLAGLMVA